MAALSLQVRHTIDKTRSAVVPALILNKLDVSHVGLAPFSDWTMTHSVRFSIGCLAKDRREPQEAKRPRTEMFDSASEISKITI